MPERRGVFSEGHGHVHDSGEHLHPQLLLLRMSKGHAQSAGPQRADECRIGSKRALA